MALYKMAFSEVRARGGRCLAFDTSNGRRATFDVALSLSQVSQLCGARRFGREGSSVGAEPRGNMIGGLFMRRTANCHGRCQEHTGAGGNGGFWRESAGEERFSNESGWSEGSQMLETIQFRGILLEVGHKLVFILCFCFTR